MGTQARVPEIRFDAPGDLSAVAARLSRVDPVRFEAIVRLVGLTDPGGAITVMLVGERAAVAKSTPSWIAGFAQGADSRIVLFPDRSPSYPYDSIEDVLQHEIAHVLIARAANGRPVPRWFHEGLALAAERPWGLEDSVRATYALAVRNLDPGALDLMFRGGQPEQARAYAVAGAWMRDIQRRHGRDAPARILRELAGDQPFRYAYARATGESLESSADAFWRDSWWYQAVSLVTSSVMLWTGVILLALLAIRTRRARNAARRTQWEEEELRTRNAERRMQNGENGDRRTENDDRADLPG